MKIYKYPSKSAEKKITSIVKRGLGFKKKDVLAVTRILEDVRKNGDKALIKYSNQFDSPGLTCRYYANGLPGVEEILARINELE